MNKLLYYLLSPASWSVVNMALCFMRIGIGLLTIGHGIPKITGGIASWKALGGMMGHLGIYFLPTLWGFLGAVTEFFGGIALVIGLGVRLACLCLAFMMFVAFVMHVRVGDSFNVYSFPLSLIVIFLGYFLIGGDTFSLDYYLTHKKS